MKKLLILLIVLTSCKKEEIYPYPDPVIEYVQSFKLDAEKYGVKLKFNKLNAIVLGGESKEYPNYAGYYTNGVIYLDTTSNKYKHHRKFLLYHELGHALLGRGDNDSPDSIMNGLPSYWYVKQDYYIKELFSFN